MNKILKKTDELLETDLAKNSIKPELFTKQYLN